LDEDELPITDRYAIGLKKLSNTAVQAAIGLYDSERRWFLPVHDSLSHGETVALDDNTLRYVAL
jgi:hypothetical protein